MNPNLPPDNSSARPDAGEPQSFELVTHTEARVLAVGVDLKATFCLYHGYEAVMCEPLGDLNDPDCFRHFLHDIETICRDRGIRPSVVAHDLHPTFQTTRYAQDTGLPLIAVQHHHAHAVSVMAEWRIDKPVVAIICDGNGYGSDGAAWGCEVLCCEADRYNRFGFLDYFPLIGGDRAAVETWRPAAALLRQAFGASWRTEMERVIAARALHELGPGAADLAVAERIMERGIAITPTSSLGRVFDGVSFLLGLCPRNEHEGQAAIALESQAVNQEVEPYPYETVARLDCVRMSAAPMIRAIVRDLLGGVEAGMIAARFHETVARMLVATAVMAAERMQLFNVVIGGGCFANQRLRQRVTQRLESRHVRVYAPRQLPCGDGGLALGQAVVAGEIYDLRNDPTRPSRGQGP